LIFARPSLLVSSGILLFGFLLLIATLTTKNQRPRPLLNKALWLAVAAGALGYAFGGPVFTATLYATAVCNYGIAQSIESAAGGRERKAARAWLAGGVVLNLAVLVWMKTAPVFTYTAGAVAVGATDALWGARTIMPVGLSFFTFHAVSYLVDAYHGRAPAKNGFIQGATYLLLLPQFVGGPVTFQSLSGQLSRRADGVSDFAFGMRRLFIGIGKRVLIAQPCAVAANIIFAWRPEDLNASAAWLAVACFTVQIYFTFSGYADMAIGLGRLFGLRGDENFRWPYAAESVRDFWQRWHIGLTTWLRAYSGVSALAPLAAEIVVVLLCAAWYGTAWSCLLWGVYHAAFLALERLGILPVSRLPWLLRHVYLVLVVGVGWVLLRAETPAAALHFLRAMIGLDVPAHVRVLPTSLALWAALIAGAIGSAPVARAVRRWSVAIDGGTTSLLMMVFATAVFLWRSVAYARASNR
jgi:alginate O-acetyltransferase complex protein AlgI